MRIWSTITPAACLLVTSTVSAGGIELGWRIDDGPLTIVEPTGVPIGASTSYIGAASDAAGLDLSWALIVDDAFDDGTGTTTNDLTITNTGDVAREVRVLARVVLDAPVVADAVDGEVGYQLVADDGGGVLETIPPQHMWCAQLGDVVAAQMFAHPSQAIAPPFGVITLFNREFADVLDAPRPTSRFGFVATFHLTAGESVSFSGDLSVHAEPTRPGDLDQNGTVDAMDLIDLLVQWGPCPDPCASCTGDVNGDCLVDVIDLIVLLDNWGP